MVWYRVSVTDMVWVGVTRPIFIGYGMVCSADQGNGLDMVWNGSQAGRVWPRVGRDWFGVGTGWVWRYSAHKKAPQTRPVPAPSPRGVLFI